MKKKEEPNQIHKDLKEINPKKTETSVLSLSEKNRLCSILESLLFATDRPQNLNTLHGVFKEENVPLFHIKEALETLRHSYASKNRGISLEEVAGGYQLITKAIHASYLRRLTKKKSFRLSSQAMEVLSIIAYQQPCLKSDVDHLRGVESGHLFRLLMEKGFVRFLKKSDLPGRPMLYGTTKKFLEVFQLKNLKELPSLKEVEILIAKEEQNLEDQKNQTNVQNLPLEDVNSYFDINQERKREERRKEDTELLKKLSERISSAHIKAKFVEEKKEDPSTEKPREKSKKMDEISHGGQEK